MAFIPTAATIAPYYASLTKVPLQLYADPFLAACQTKGEVSIYVCMVLNLPGGVTKRYSNAPINSKSLGPFDNRVLSFNIVSRGVSTRSESLSNVEFDVEIADTDRDFATQWAGSNGSTIRRSPATIYIGAGGALAGDGIRTDDWFVAFSGIINTANETSPFVWKIRLTPNDAWLQSFVPLLPVTTLDFPSIDASAKGIYSPIIYGTHSSAGNGNAGAITCPYVNTVNLQYLVAAGHVAVTAVYSNKVLKATPADYGVAYKTVNGKLFTLINFVANQGTNVITADVTGYDDIGDGTGNLIDNPAKIIQHFLCNWVWTNHLSGAWVDPTTVPIDLASFGAAADFFDHYGCKGAKMIFGTSQARGINWLNEWASSYVMRPFWGNNGKLKIAVLDPSVPSIYPADIVRLNEDEFTAFDVEHNVLDIKAKVVVQYVYQPAAGKYTVTANTKDLTLASAENVTDNRLMAWGADTL